MKSSLPPIIDENTRILILGSLPGEESLHQQRYYVNPRNYFWRIVFNIFKLPVPETYEEKIQFLKSKGIGLWDVVHTAQRLGSSDNSIRNAKPNDFASLLKKYPNIKALMFNGRKSEKVFLQVVIKNNQALPTSLILRHLPSSSSALTSPFDGKVAKWNIIKDLID